MLLQPRHDLDEIAGAVAVVELPLEDVVPCILTGARRPRQAEDVGAAREASAGARLDGGGPTFWNVPGGRPWRSRRPPFSNSGRTASGVTSRPVAAVPPVVMTTSTAASWRSALHLGLISGTSSYRTGRAKACPALRASATGHPRTGRSARRAGDRSALASDATGMKGRVCRRSSHGQALSLGPRHCLRMARQSSPAGRGRCRS
jgi:hypothetical protein